MAESILYDLAGNVLTQLGTSAVEQICLIWGVKREKDHLAEILSAIRVVISDAESAEKKQEKKDDLNAWLGLLKHALLDADDLLDEFMCEKLRSKVVKQGDIKKKVRKYFSPSHSLAFSIKMGYKIKGIVDRFDKIAADIPKFNLVKREDKGDMHVVHREREATDSSEPTSVVFGRNIDKENIIKRLRASPNHGGNVSVIPIIGIGGLGKTTLAKLVFNDERVVKELFQLKMWVHVSMDFHVEKLTKEILKSAIDIDCDALTSLEAHYTLKSTLVKNKFLLVLDDVWNEDRVKWEELITLLSIGVSGSKIIVTGRSELVANVTGEDPYELGFLIPEDCTSLFVKWAFRKGEENAHPKLLKIGEEIVEKCGGVPLAVQTIGSLLYGEEESYWKHVRDSELWKVEREENKIIPARIIPALKLSYNGLPSHLKRCFAFCSIFPKSYVFSSIELIQFWMAHGLLESSSGIQDLEDIGERYIQKLRSRSFFQEVEDHHYFLRFKMHDLLHELAFSVAEAEFSIINSHPRDISKTIRHVSFCDKNLPLENDPSSLLKLHARTIFFPIREFGPTSKSFVENCISKFNHLRVLNLSDSDFKVLPRSIGKLKQLRYLTVSRNKRIKKLPNSICELQSLQTLGLVGCEELEELPRDIGDLIRLRCLSITTKQMSFPGKGLGCLKSLRTLWISGCDNLEFLGEGMQQLTALRTLVIVGCASLECLPSSMTCLTELQTLVIADCEKLKLDWKEGIKGLRSFSIGRLPQLVALPQWLESAAESLSCLRIGDCQKLNTLPDWLQNLKFLEKLVIEDCHELSALPQRMDGLTALKKLKIKCCPKLWSICRPENGEDWHKISSIESITLIEKPSRKVETGESSIY